MDNRSDIYRRAATLFCICAYGVLAYLALKFLLAPLLPLLVALAISMWVSGAAKRLHELTGIPQGLYAFLLVSLCLLFCVLGFIYLGRALLSELSAAISFLSGTEQLEIMTSLERLPVLGELLSRSEEYAGTGITQFITSALQQLSSQLGSILAAALRSTPSALGNAVFFVMLVYYMSMDFDSVRELSVRLIPTSWHNGAGKVLGSCTKFARAYFKLFVLTFLELLFGLLIICPRMALLVSLVTAALDILPLVGAGIVLVPWAIICFVTGETLMGIELAVLYLLIGVIRRIAEPKILGEGLGLSPVSVLIFMYLGYKLFGALGLLFSPLAASVLCGIRPALFEKKSDKF